MTFDLTLHEGKYLVRLARKKIEARFKRTRLDLSDAPLKTREVCGVFVTLNILREGEKQLRGCIGYPYPIKPLVESVIDVAEAAAFEDPRFPRLTQRELSEVVIEVSVLTPPEKMNVEKPEQLPALIKVGVDGLIAKRGSRSGLLLPQVAPEWGWDAQELLSQTCVKAGLPPDSWLLTDTEIFKFQAIIFIESLPGGEVMREESRG